MVYLIVGGSCAGKSSFVKNKWIKNYNGQMKRDGLPYFETENVILLGTYDEERGRRVGTDRISRKDIPKILPWIIKFYNSNPDKDIVLEGDKIISRPLWNQLIKNNIECKLFLIDCPLEIGIRRIKELNPKSTERSWKSSYSKARNIYNEYKDIFDGEIISSENIDDFSEFGIDI